MDSYVLNAYGGMQLIISQECVSLPDSNTKLALAITYNGPIMTLMSQLQIPIYPFGYVTKLLLYLTIIIERISFDG